MSGSLFNKNLSTFTLAHAININKKWKLWKLFYTLEYYKQEGYLYTFFPDMW